MTARHPQPQPPDPAWWGAAAAAQEPAAAQSEEDPPTPLHDGSQEGHAARAGRPPGVPQDIYHPWATTGPQGHGGAGREAPMGDSPPAGGRTQAPPTADDGRYLGLRDRGVPPTSSIGIQPTPRGNPIDSAHPRHGSTDPYQEVAVPDIIGQDAAKTRADWAHSMQTTGAGEAGHQADSPANSAQPHPSGHIAEGHPTDQPPRRRLPSRVGSHVVPAEHEPSPGPNIVTVQGVRPAGLVHRVQPWLSPVADHRPPG